MRAKMANGMRLRTRPDDLGGPGRERLPAAGRAADAAAPAGAGHFQRQRRAARRLRDPRGNVAPRGQADRARRPSTGRSISFLSAASCTRSKASTPTRPASILATPTTVCCSSAMPAAAARRSRTPTSWPRCGERQERALRAQARDGRGAGPVPALRGGAGRELTFAPCRPLERGEARWTRGKLTISIRSPDSGDQWCHTSCRAGRCGFSSFCGRLSHRRGDVRAIAGSPLGRRRNPGQEQ